MTQQSSKAAKQQSSKAAKHRAYPITYVTTPPVMPDLWARPKAF